MRNSTQKYLPDKKDQTFIGIRIPTELHTQLYRAKASLELQTGKFYGMGRLMERVIRSGLADINKELQKAEKAEKAEKAGDK